MKHKLPLLLLVVLCLSCASLFATDSSSSDTTDDSQDFTFEPYKAEEFPSWAVKLRRGESLFFGSLAFSMPVVTLGYGVGVSAGLLSYPDDDLQLLKQELVVAATISLFIAVTDYIIGEFN
ncbi:MAG: hypothetical protein LKE40_02480 [Spirochaetia bacterium]|nr:hypothetical protein [Spirochaetia bacterium]